MNNKCKGFSVPHDILDAIEEAKLELLELQADILELSESLDDCAVRYPLVHSEQLH